MSLPTVFGHEQTWTRLLESIDRNRLPHALLFIGPAGVGKAMVARRLAARLVCENAEAAPCGICIRCVQFAAQSHPDCISVGLLAGKKEISIDLIRQLKRFIQVRAVVGRRKIAIVDDADRLSLAAQNAILKTLEEPPPHSLLMLTAANVQALLPTVRSRCQVIPFHPLTAAQVEAALVQHADIAPPLALALAALAQGSPGRALRLRTLVESDATQVLRQLLAELDVDRYVTVVGLARSLGRTEQEMIIALEVLQSWYHEAAVRAAGGNDSHAAQQTTRAAGVIAEALFALQRRNPNRPLLAEALALQLARS